MKSKYIKFREAKTALKKIETSGNRYIVKMASCSMPQSCWGFYGRVAVIEVDHDSMKNDGITMISCRAKGVKSIPWMCDKQNVGDTDKSAFWEAYNAAVELARSLNANETELK